MIKKNLFIIGSFLLSFLAFEFLEHFLFSVFGWGIDLLLTSFGIGGLVLFFVLKYHLICCMLPAIFLFWRQQKKNKLSCQCQEIKCEEKITKN